MNLGFWGKLQKPFTALAPMEDVTDTVFRQMIGKIARPDVFFTEFTHVEAISHGELSRLRFSESEHPIVAQIWGTTPESFCKAAGVVKELGFDGVDINMGCPVRDVVKTGGGGARIKAEFRMQNVEIIKATKEGAKGLPVSVKTRIGFNKIETEEWMGFLLEQDLAVISVHGRLVKDMSKYPADWGEIKKAVSLRDQAKFKTLIIGNGDITNIQDSRFKIQDSGVDGVMVGRGVLINPAVFDKNGRMLTLEEKMDYLSQHAKLFEETWKGTKPMVEFRKFIKMYINGFEGAAALRQKLMESYY
jgi:tRNA-dihydrouridine synthase